MTLITASEACAVLNVSLRAIDQLWQAELLTEPIPIGRQKLYVEAEVIALANRAVIPRPYPRAYVVRVLAKANADDHSRAYKGFTAGLYDPSDPKRDAEHRRLALAGWWPCRDPEAQVGHPLIATLAGFVVGAYRISGPGQRSNGRVMFDVEPLDRDTASLLENRRLTLTGGPISLEIGPGTTNP
ncbi:hypothetical protein [Microbacterium sp. RG1]|uniref:hypothetical protein n=1 Tax=Microbacterium sp. RG1 TaxID=2489212 RepID=UPI0010CA2338|nr:hypothetical protein [Microbacterium sp. RG1]QCQ17249.1 hypothetical protein EHF32_11235 [Microbacterium sp. RG1]